MKARFLAITALILGMVSCQKDQAGLDVIVGGEQEVMVNVSLAEATRATSADSGIQNVNNSVYDLRYILEVYDTNDDVCVYRDVKTVATDVKSVSFPVRLIPERNYNFVVWADFVTNDSTNDFYYTTTNGLDEVTIITEKWVQMEEARDAYTGQATVTGYNSGKSINIPLTRPFGKLRVVTTDIDALKKLNGEPMPKAIIVRYTNPVYTQFNALVQSPNTEASKSYTYDLTNVYGEDWNSESRTLFTDYIFGTKSGSIQFTMDVTMTNDNVVRNNFNTEIPVKRNYLTTITGDILTDGNNIKVDVTDDFENAGSTDPDYEHSTISSDAEFLAALNADGKFIVISDLHIKDNVITPGLLSTRAGEATGKVSTINLNGYTITVENKTNEAFATVTAGNTLFLESGLGGGKIVLAEGSTASFIKNEGNVVLTSGEIKNESTAAPVVAGTIVVNEDDATLNDNKVAEENKITVSEEDDGWLEDVLKNGGTYVFTADMTADQIKVTAAGNETVVLDGNGYTFTYTGSARAIEIPKEATGANVTIKNLNIAFSKSYCERGINFNVTGGTLVIDNVKVSETGNVATYALNFPGYSDEATVTINNSYLRGNIALNVWGEKMTINATGSEFVNYDKNDVEGYPAISLSSDASTVANETVVNINGGRIVALDEKGELASAVRNSTSSGEVNISETTEVIGHIVYPVAIIDYGTSQFYSFATLQDAIDKVCKDNNGSVRLIKDITIDEPINIPADKTVVIDLSGKTITGTMVKPNHVVMNYGTLTIKNGTISSTAGNGGSALCNEGTLTVENATINGSSIFDNGGWPSYPINNYGPVMTVKNSTINGYQGAVACNAAGTTTMENCTINKHYSKTSSHVFYISHTDAEVIVNGGTYTHKGMDGSLAYTMGKIIVNDGTFNTSDGGYGIAALSGGRVEVTGGTFNAGFFGWGGSIEVTGGTFKANPKDYLADGYKAIEKNGKYYVVTETVDNVVASKEDLPVENGKLDTTFEKDVNLYGDITVSANETNANSGYGATGVTVTNGAVLNGQGHKLTVNNAWGTWDCVVAAQGGTIKNLTVSGAMRGIFMPGANGDVYIDNVIFDNVIYTFNSDAGNKNYGVYISNSTLNGWTSHSDVHKEVIYTNCKFGEGNGYAFCRPYGTTSFVGCDFEAGFEVDAVGKITFENCTIGGVALTADNLATLVTSNTANASVK